MKCELFGMEKKTAIVVNCDTSKGGFVMLLCMLQRISYEDGLKMRLGGLRNGFVP